MYDYNTRFVAENTIAVFSFPLPSPTNYSLLANLVTILSHVYHRVIIVTGNFVKQLPFLMDDLRLSNKKRVLVYDIGCKLPQRSDKTPLFKKLFIYIKIHIGFKVAIIRLHSDFRTALLFIGLPHMFPIALILKLLRKKIVVY